MQSLLKGTQSKLCDALTPRRNFVLHVDICLGVLHVGQKRPLVELVHGIQNPRLAVVFGILRRRWRLHAQEHVDKVSPANGVRHGPEVDLRVHDPLMEGVEAVQPLRLELGTIKAGVKVVGVVLVAVGKVERGVPDLEGALMLFMFQNDPDCPYPPLVHVHSRDGVAHVGDACSQAGVRWKLSTRI